MIFKNCLKSGQLNIYQIISKCILQNYDKGFTKSKKIFRFNQLDRKKVSPKVRKIFICNPLLF